MIHVKRILYPTDFSSYSTQAYFHAVALAEVHGASLTIVYVYVPGLAGQFNNDDDERRHWREQLEQIRPANPAIPVHHVFLDGDPAQEIIRYATDAGIDLIVMGTHGRSGLERLVVGSVTERVMREAHCSVMAVKLPKGLHMSEKTEVALASSPG
jgi:nucleotide-binding universal stress UspA family protein